MSVVSIAILIVIIYICLFTLVDRICKCVEHCATAKSFSKTVETNSGSAALMRFVNKSSDKDGDTL